MGSLGRALARRQSAIANAKLPTGFKERTDKRGRIKGIPVISVCQHKVRRVGASNTAPDSLVEIMSIDGYLYGCVLCGAYIDMDKSRAEFKGRRPMLSRPLLPRLRRARMHKG